VPDEITRYRIDTLWPIGGRIMLAAQYKAGKTTLTGNVMRSLCDGVWFLDQFRAEQAFVTLIDFEMDKRTVRHWLRDQGIRQTDNARVWPLRGKVSSFDILGPQIRSEWAARIRSSEVLILDCLRPILDALGLDENREVGRLLQAIMNYWGRLAYRKP
jgi:hypothetical protein